MVSADSQQISRARCYSGTPHKAGVGFSRTGLSPSTAGHPKTISANHDTFLLPSREVALEEWVPQPRTHNPYPVSHAYGLASSAFARHYSRNHNCFLFLRVLRCFTSPRSPPLPMYSVVGDTTSLVPGFPIRTSSDPRSVDSSPRHIAASHVLHRLSMPRHPPCALKHLQTQKPRNKNCKTKQDTQSCF